MEDTLCTVKSSIVILLPHCLFTCTLPLIEPQTSFVVGGSKKQKELVEQRELEQ